MVLDGLDQVVDFWIRQKQHYQYPGSNWSGLDWSPNRWLFWGSGEVGRKSRSRESKCPIKDVYTNGKMSFVLVSVTFAEQKRVSIINVCLTWGLFPSLFQNPLKRAEPSNSWPNYCMILVGICWYFGQLVPLQVCRIVYQHFLVALWPWM